MAEHQTTPSAKRRRSLWRALGWVLRGPVDAFNPRAVAEGGQAIGRLASIIRSGPQPDPRVRVDADHGLDVSAIAFLAGATEAEVRQQMANRLRQTAVATYVYLAGGAGFLLVWVYAALLHVNYASLSYIVALLGFCGTFFLFAFHNALVNWQVRTQRLGTAREFLATEDSWWPS